MTATMTLVTMFCVAMTAAATGITNEPAMNAKRSLSFLERKVRVDFRDPNIMASANAAKLGTQWTALAAIVLIVALWIDQPQYGLRDFIALLAR